MSTLRPLTAGPLTAGPLAALALSAALVLSFQMIMPQAQAAVSPPAPAPALALSGTRAQFVIDEPIEFSVPATRAARAGATTLVLTHTDGGTVKIEVPAAPAGAGAEPPLAPANGVRLITVHPNVLKPGQYTATLGDADGNPVAAESGGVTFGVAPAEHANAYYVGQWVHHGGAYETTLAKGGWMYMTGDYVSLHPRKPAPHDLADSYVQASMRPYALMVCGGGHQLDLQMVNDWGDPWVQRAVIWRVQLAALSDRIYPMAGLHIFDEPGLTWWPILGADGKQIGANPFAIPHQLDEFKRATGKEIPSGTFAQTLPKYFDMMPDWLGFMQMRMKYLGQAWYGTVWATQSVHPPFGTVNQVSSSYAPADTADGVDSTQNKPYSTMSGHGQYSDLPFGALQPLHGSEGFMGFSWDRPHLYLPMWYTHNWATIRNAVWVSYASKLEGMMYTPEQDFPLDNSTAGYLGTHTVFEIAETNRRMAMVGDAVRQLPRTLSPVAVIQSNTQASWDIANENHPALAKGTPPYVSHHRDAVQSEFFRILETGMIPNLVDEAEVTEKGADFLKQWKVLYLPGLTYATPEFRKALEGFVAAGGKLIQSKGDTLLIKGSIVAEHTFPDMGEYWKTKVNGLLETAARLKTSDPAAAAAAQAEASQNNTDLAYRKLNNEGAPNFAKELGEWLGPQPYASSNPNVLLRTHSAGEAHYLFLANNEQSKQNPRVLKHDLIPAQTDVTVPEGGVVYDLFNGGAVAVENHQAAIKLAAGDGALLLHLPAEPGPIKVSAKAGEDNVLDITVQWGKVGYLPFRLRIYDLAGNLSGDYFRATIPGEGAYHHKFALGRNAAAGNWRVEVSEWLTAPPGAKAETSVAIAQPPLKPAPPAQLASANAGDVSIYFDDARRIAELVAGKMQQPDYKQLNWDAPRVFGLDPKKFAVFSGKDNVDAANKLADAFKARGMTVSVNPEFKTVPFQREPDRGGAAGQAGNYETIFANAIVLPGSPLVDSSMNRGYLNRVVTDNFPGAGRAYVQWGSSCFQAGWQDVFILGDTDAGVRWLLERITTPPGAAPDAPAAAPAGPALNVAVAARGGPQLHKSELPRTLTVSHEVKTYDTPVGIGASPDGKITYIALYDGSVIASDAAGKQLWSTPAGGALLEGSALAVSPKGDRLAVAGYPGILVLDTADGKVLDGYRAKPVAIGNPVLANLMTSVAWNDAGTHVAGGWVNNTYAGLSTDPHDVIILDANGKPVASAKVAGNVFGVAFVPGTDTLLIGADQLTAVNAADGSVLWSNPIRGAQAFAFSADGKTAAAGGWGQTAAQPKIPVGVFNLSDGKVTTTATFDSVIGGLAFTPGRAGGADNQLIVAVWGGTHPLYVVAEDQPQAKAPAAGPVTNAKPFFSSRFGFQDVRWSPALKSLVATEQGGRLWLLGADGKPAAMLDDTAGTTVYRLSETPAGLLLARMNRVVQTVQAGTAK